MAAGEEGEAARDVRNGDGQCRSSSSLENKLRVFDDVKFRDHSQRVASTQPERVKSTNLLCATEQITEFHVEKDNASSWTLTFIERDTGIVCYWPR